MSLGRPAWLDEEFLKCCLDSEDGGDRAMKLLQDGADASARNKDGETALHLLVRGISCCDRCGVQTWRRELAQALVELDGVDPSHRDKKGRTAKDIADTKEFEDFSSELSDLQDTYQNELNQPLRFRMNDRIEASVDGGYEVGTIAKTRDGRNAYRIRLDSGTEVWAPKDCDGFVRRIGGADDLDEGGDVDQADALAPQASLGSRSKRPALRSAAQSFRSDDHEEIADHVDGEKNISICGGFGDSDDDGDDDEPPDAATDALIEAFEQQWTTAAEAGPAVRVQLDPKIYSTVATMATSNLHQKQQSQAGVGAAGASPLGAIGRKGGKKKKNQKQKKKKTRS
mmetsp:Transcript_17121/g.33904  ORF Transcript_17121/g.33904 Transcript_17121/m.33904 type:complete len:341 (+) Transcript_17121:16-1038(+)